MGPVQLQLREDVRSISSGDRTDQLRHTSRRLIVLTGRLVVSWQGYQHSSHSSAKCRPTPTIIFFCFFFTAKLVILWCKNNWSCEQCQKNFQYDCTSLRIHFPSFYYNSSSWKLHNTHLLASATVAAVHSIQHMAALVTPQDKELQDKLYSPYVPQGVLF